jgi:hypothetical protein
MIMQAKENLTTLCGFSREETELDFSDQNLDAGDAVLVANDISNMGALSSLNLASNSIGGYLKYNKFNATPEGRVSYSFCKSSRQLLSFSLFSRPSRYR